LSLRDHALGLIGYRSLWLLTTPFSLARPAPTWPIWRMSALEGNADFPVVRPDFSVWHL
jgi:hypothetical protein